MTKKFVVFVVTQPRHFVLHIPNTPPHHHLCSRKKSKKRSTASVRKKKIDPIQRAKCQTNPYQKRPNIRYKAKKKANPRDGVFSQTIKQKKNPFFPL